MNRSVFSIILLALIGHSCVAKIVVQTSEPKHITELHDAVIDIVMTCYGDPGSAVGILGDSNGSILKTLRLKYFIPVVLIDRVTLDMKTLRFPDPSRVHKLQAVVFAADSVKENVELLHVLQLSVWWNQFANFLFMDTTPNYNNQCSKFDIYTYIPVFFGMLNSQFICYDRSSGIMIYNSNQFTHQAPPVWRLEEQFSLGLNRLLSVFNRRYQEGGQACEALNFPKTIDIGGWPVCFRTSQPRFRYQVNNPQYQSYVSRLSNTEKKFFEARGREQMWFMDTIIRALNATAMIIKLNESRAYEGSDITRMGITLTPAFFSSNTRFIKAFTSSMILPLTDEQMFAVTKHTEHKSQLTKILTVVDKNSRIGVGVVYLITFLFFKVFLGQALMPALLNLVRLTCNTGLPKLPQNLAPTVYLACLLMFVVTFQGIFTGNLATLLTTTIPYRNVETKQDIVHLGYTIYRQKNTFEKLDADPVLNGHIIEIPQLDYCIDYLLREPLVACVIDVRGSIFEAMKRNLHVSRDPIQYDYSYYIVTPSNPLHRRLESIIKRWHEHGLPRLDPIFETLRLQLITDDEVKKNTDRRVMNMGDLSFTFVILCVGLLCSFICFIGEIVIYKIRLKIAKRRNRVRARLAWGVKANSFLSFPSLNWRFNARRLFSKRR